MTIKKRYERNQREKRTKAQDVLTDHDILELMGVMERGHRRRRGAWRQA